MNARPSIGRLKRYPAYKSSGVEWLEEIRADILALEQETEGLLMDIVGGVHV